MITFCMALLQWLLGDQMSCDHSSGLYEELCVVYLFSDIQILLVRAKFLRCSWVVKMERRAHY